MIRLFRHYVPLSLVTLAIVEAVIFFTAVYAGKALTFISYEYELNYDTLAEAIAAYSENPLTLSGMLVPGLVVALVMIAVITAVGLYERNFWDGRGDMFLRLGVSFVLGFLALSLLYFVLPDLRLGRREFGFSFSLALFGVMIARWVFLSVTNHETIKRRVLVLGSGQRAAEIQPLLAQQNAGFKVTSFVRMSGDAEVIHTSRALSPRLSLYDLTEQEQVDEIVIAMDDRRAATLPMTDILDCKISGIRVSDHVSFIERETGKIALDSLRPSDMIFSDGFHQAVLKTFGKRSFDIIVSFLLLVIAAPFMLLTALAIRLESNRGDPIFYLQKRVGKNDLVFKVIKFRSMRVDAEKDGQARWAQKNDPRITAVGAFIRKVRLDELPQLFNVLLGQMSFVGPRPERPELVKQLQEQIPYYDLRHRVKPGITGWAQLCYPYGNTVEDARRKLEYDLYYIKNYSLFLDFMVLLQTAHVVLWAKGQ